jgi:hypothetical protein
MLSMRAGAAGSDCQVSTNDAIQALVFTLYAHLRGWPLVPTSPQMFTTTAGEGSRSF